MLKSSTNVTKNRNRNCHDVARFKMVNIIPNLSIQAVSLLQILHYKLTKTMQYLNLKELLSNSMAETFLKICTRAKNQLYSAN